MLHEIKWLALSCEAFSSVKAWSWWTWSPKSNCQKTCWIFYRWPLQALNASNPRNSHLPPSADTLLPSVLGHNSSLQSSTYPQQWRKSLQRTGPSGTTWQFREGSLLPPKEETATTWVTITMSRIRQTSCYELLTLSCLQFVMSQMTGNFSLMTMVRSEPKPLGDGFWPEWLLTSLLILLFTLCEMTWEFSFPKQRSRLPRRYCPFFPCTISTAYDGPHLSLPLLISYTPWLSDHRSGFSRNSFLTLFLSPFFKIKIVFISRYQFKREN